MGFIEPSGIACIAQRSALYTGNSASLLANIGRRNLRHPALISVSLLNPPARCAKPSSHHWPYLALRDIAHALEDQPDLPQ